MESFFGPNENKMPARSGGRAPPHFGRMTPEKLVEAEIVSGNRTANDYNKMTQQMKFPQIKKMTELAVDYDNIPALKGIAKSNQYAVAEAVFAPDGKINSQKFDAKYLGGPDPDQSLGDMGKSDLLGLFIIRNQIPADIRSSLRDFVPKPKRDHVKYVEKRLPQLASNVSIVSKRTICPSAIRSSSVPSTCPAGPAKCLRATESTRCRYPRTICCFTTTARRRYVSMRSV